MERDASVDNVVLFQKNFYDRQAEVDRLVPIVTNIIYTEDVERAKWDRTPIMHEIRREGLDL